MRQQDSRSTLAHAACHACAMRQRGPECAHTLNAQALTRVPCCILRITCVCAQGRVHGLQRASCLATAVSRASCGRATRLRGELGDARMELAKARKQVRRALGA